MIIAALSTTGRLRLRQIAAVITRSDHAFFTSGQKLLGISGE
jgi:hypothetical protein